MSRPRKGFAHAGGPYIERKHVDLSTLDRSLSEAYGRLVAKAVRIPRRAARLVAPVARLDAKMRNLSDAALREAALGLRAPLVSRGFTIELVAEAFALVREATARCTGMRHYPVQIMGGGAMLDGRLIEMNTGEGKTITALLPAVTAALAGFPVHVITVNDYLAKRDADHLAPVYRALGLDVGLVQHGDAPPSRRAAYASDVTYCTNKELTFDYLRDRITLGRLRGNARVQLNSVLGDGQIARKLLLRGLCFGIVDEADSVLIDEARTPLLISSDGGKDDEYDAYKLALSIADALQASRDYDIAQNDLSIDLTASGRRSVDRLSEGLTGQWLPQAARRDLVVQALTARHLFKRDKHYIVADDKIQIVDEYTGRVMADRFWERGLHQLIEVKEGCSSTGLRETLARITYQRFFRRYMRLAGMSGTLKEVAPELWSTYGLRVARIPPNRAVRRRDAGTHIYATATEKWSAVQQRVSAFRATGRPILIGTRSVEASETVAAFLARAELPHVVLNARQDADEAAIVAAAGQAGRVTIATNMAGRGTDIILSDAVRQAGGLHVILTEYHESARIDRQLYGRSGRQGDPGSFEVLASLEDDLFTRFAPRLSALLSFFARRRSSPSMVATLLRRIVQSRVERRHASTRRDNSRLDQRMDRALGFAGSPE